MWHSALVLLVVLAAAPPAFAAGADDPLASPACTRALEQLRQAETSALAQRRKQARDGAQAAPAADTQAVQTRQRRAAVACRLDTEVPTPPAQPRLREPVRVSPVMPPAAVPARPAPGGASPLPQPQTLSACDDQGCWTSDGQRLLRAGSMLIGPRGLCSQRGTALHCP